MSTGSHPFVAGGLAVLLWLVPAGVVYAVDDYLSVLEAEAEDTGRQTQRTSTATIAAPVKSKTARIATTITPDLGFEDFENELHNSYSGTHLLYMKLRRDQQRAAWKSYLDDNEVRAVREHIVSLLSSS